jgi:hypothetical protein
MKFNIKTKQESNCKKRKFCIYHHELTMGELDEYILQIMFDPDKLSYLFQLNAVYDDNDRINQLRRFVETDFYNRENDVSDNDIQKAILNNNNNSYYSFFAEALMARLNIDYIDRDLITAVISVDDTITTVGTGADACMLSDSFLVIGEAKFYDKIGGGVDSIIKDKSFNSKFDSFINKVIKQKSDIFLRNIDGVVNRKTKAEIGGLPIIFTGFVLHGESTRGDYTKHYDKIENIDIDNFPQQYEIHLYHLPVRSKLELIFKAQKRAIDLIIGLNN